MGFCRSAVYVLILLMYLHSAVVKEAPDEKTVCVFLNDSALLPCSGIHCTETVSWVYNSSSVVAQCDRSSCSSTEGYQMSQSDYWKGNFSLNITAVTPSNTGSYSCKCGIILLQDVLLQTISTPTVKVEFNATAVLPCSESCPGVVRWSMSSKSSDIPVAECNQTFCRSVKEGYQMISNQYLQGNLSLIISKADFSKRGLYVCECDGNYKCKVHLQINPLKTQEQIKPGDSLLLELDILDPVEVIYNETDTANQTSRQICTVIGGSLQCEPEYKHRTSLSSSTLELRGVNESDSGVYIIRDTENEEDIHIYNVNIQGDYPDGDQRFWVPMWSVWLMVGLLIFLCVVVFVLLAVIVCMCKNVKCLETKEKQGHRCIKCGASEEGSQNTERDPLASTDDLVDTDSPTTANRAGTGPGRSEQWIPLCCRSENTSIS